MIHRLEHHASKHIRLF